MQALHYKLGLLALARVEGQALGRPGVKHADVLPFLFQEEGGQGSRSCICCSRGKGYTFGRVEGPHCRVVSAHGPRILGSLLLRRRNKLAQIVFIQSRFFFRKFCHIISCHIISYNDLSYVFFSLLGCRGCSLGNAHPNISRQCSISPPRVMVCFCMPLLQRAGLSRDVGQKTFLLFFFSCAHILLVRPKGWEWRKVPLYIQDL